MSIPEKQSWLIDWSKADELLRQRCATVLDQLAAADAATAARFLANPRAIHRFLYEGLTPPEHPNFAGHYRGSDDPVLRKSWVAASFSENEGTGLLVPPSEVAGYMEQYGRGVLRVALQRYETAHAAVDALAPVLIAFGMIHPFLDGNGHIQRITFAHLIQKAGFQLGSHWSVHPRPYDAQVDRALAAGDQEAVARFFEAFVASSAISCSSLSG